MTHRSPPEGAAVLVILDTKGNLAHTMTFHPCTDGRRPVFCTVRSSARRATSGRGCI